MSGVKDETAWFMTNRIREAMREPPTDRMGSGGKTVEIDETYAGGKKRRAGKADGRQYGPAAKEKYGPAAKERVITLVERGGGHPSSVSAVPSSSCVALAA
jgi:hypothetical protein